MGAGLGMYSSSQVSSTYQMPMMAVQQQHDIASTGTLILGAAQFARARRIALFVALGVGRIQLERNRGA